MAQNLRNILQQISILKSKYDEINKISGTNFNIFRVLKIETEEVRMHSAFIAELLNPKGSHDMGVTFLKLLLDQFDIELDLNTVYVKIEKYIGKTTDDEGGRMDIAILDNNMGCVVIENKIYAGEQHNQIVRYNNFCKPYTNRHLFYLTLNGDEPSAYSAKDLECGLHYKLLSYSEDIEEWLNKCKMASVNYPLLRETIQQYINLIKHLTGQVMSEKLNSEIADLILSSNKNLQSALIVDNVLNDIKTHIQKLFWVELEKSLTQIINGDFVIHSNYEEKLVGYYYKRGDAYKWGGICILQFKSVPICS